MHHLGLIIVAYLAVATSCSAALPQDSRLWAEFKLNYSKSYETEQLEEIHRSNFMENLHELRLFNAEDIETDNFELKINELADLSILDIKRMNGFKLPRDKNGQIRHDLLRNTPEGERFLKSILAAPIEVPDEVDWRQVPGRVSEVKNQGMCGSCWAFATTGALEGQEVARSNNRKTSKELTALSEQNLIDCVKGIQTNGCHGGVMSEAFDFIKNEGGIDSEESYPYEGVDRKCRFDKTKSVLSDKGFVILPEGDEQTLKEVVAKFGPVAVAIDAHSLWFQFYWRGVYVNKHCYKKKMELDHGVLVVGYGTDPKRGDYWIVKNSWGKHWGDHGYIKMARNRDNQCGIATMATLPTF